MNKIRPYMEGSRQYIVLALVIFGLALLYHYYPQANVVGLAILSVIIVTFVISGKFKLAWAWLSYILLGYLIGLISGFFHFAYIAWGILLYILAVIIRISLEDKSNK